MIDAEKLNALVDNELEPAERAEVEKLLASDPNSAAHVGAIRAMKTALKDNAEPVRCEDEWKACVKRLNAIDGAKKTRAIVDRWAWAMCSCLFVFIVVGGLFNRVNPGVHAGAADLSRAGMEKPIRDVYHWLKSEIGGTPTVPLQVINAYEGMYRDHRTATIYLKDAKGQVSLVAVQGNGSKVVVDGVTPMDDGQHFVGQNGDKNTIVWMYKGNVLILSGSRSADELLTVANQIQF